MASVATVVVVGVKLPRPLLVKRGRRRWVGGIRRLRSPRGQVVLMVVTWTRVHYILSILDLVYVVNQPRNVSAPLIAHPVPTCTKIKVVSPLAKHVPVVLTALLVRQVVRILQLLVLLEPMPVVQHRVIHVPVVLTALLVPQVVPFVVPVSTTTKLLKLWKHLACHA